MKRKLRMGIIGRGQEAFIGEVHRTASRLNGMIDLVYGAFSANPDRSKAFGEAFFLDPSRVYVDDKEMLAKEAKLLENVRMDFVSIVTLNHVHLAPANLALESVIHVCDKAFYDFVGNGQNTKLNKNILGI